MKKLVFILMTVLISVFSHLQAQDTIMLQNIYPYFVIDTINKTHIYPEVMNPSVCYDEGPNDPLIINSGMAAQLNRLACENKSLKAAAQGFMFDDTTAIDGILGWTGVVSLYTPSNVGFKLGIMDENLNVIYQNDYVFDVSNIPSSLITYNYIPFDSVLHLNGFNYVFVEWPDSACVGGTFYAGGGQYQDDYAVFSLAANKEDYMGGLYDPDFCIACNVKYPPLFKWYGDNYWVDLYSLRCLNDFERWWFYGAEKDGEEFISIYAPPINFFLYYDNNSHNGEDAGGNSGLSDVNVSHLVSVHPNPAKDIVTVQSSFKVKEIEIHNALGQVVLRKQGSQNIETIDVSNLQSGAYIVRIKTQRGFANKKILIE
jgi:hypothetical protein